jgi:hypothetical protein
MNTDRIKEIQEETAYPKSVSVQQALLKVWNECEQEQLRIAAVSGSYVVFENSQEQEGLVQLSVTLPTLERAREYVKAWKSKQLYIYLLVE